MSQPAAHEHDEDNAYGVDDLVRMLALALEFERGGESSSAAAYELQRLAPDMFTVVEEGSPEALAALAQPDTFVLSTAPQAPSMWADLDPEVERARNQPPPSPSEWTAHVRELTDGMQRDGFSQEKVDRFLLIDKLLNKQIGGFAPKCQGMGFPEEFSRTSPYVLTHPDATPDGEVPPGSAHVLNLEDHSRRPTGTINALAALGDSEHVAHVAYREDGVRLYQDVVFGPGRSVYEQAALARIRPGDQRSVVSGPLVERTYYDEIGRPYANLLLNHYTRPSTQHELIPLLVLRNPDTDHIQRAWMWGAQGHELQEDKFALVVFDEIDGRKLTMKKNCGITQHFSGPKGSERMVMACMDAENQYRQVLDGVGENGPVVSENYAGPPNNSYLVRRNYVNGTVDYFTGTVPQRVVLSRKWYPDGRMVHYAGERDNEVPIRQTFVPRYPGHTLPDEPNPDDPDEELQLILPWPATSQPRSEFRIGMRVRGVGLSRNDLNNRAGTVLGYLPEKNRWSVDFGNGVAGNIKPENLVSEEVFLADRAAREANRSEARRARTDRRRAEQLERQERRKEEARAAAALAAAEAAPFDATQERPSAPAVGRHTSRDMALCPISRRLMCNAVLAEDGYVYDHASIMAYWDDHGFVSPITNQRMGVGLYPHIPLRSLAREIFEYPNDLKWGRVSTDPLEMLECPITQDVMVDPVRAADGHVYERTDLERWFSAGHETSPLTNAPMSVHVRADLTTRAYCAAWHD